MAHVENSGAGQARKRRIDCARLGGGGIGFQPGRARIDSEPAQELALRQRAKADGASAREGAHQSGEIDMRRKVVFARPVERIGEGVSTDSL